LANRPIFALIGSETLLGREIRDLVATNDPGFDLRLIGVADEEAGRITRVGDEPALVEVLSAEALDGVHAVFLAGDAASSAKVLELAPDATVIDLTWAAEERAEARVRAPMIETSGDLPGHDDGAIYVIAHPAAMALALFLRRLHSVEPIRAAVIDVLVPASEFGAAGVTELQQQTVSLLSFKNQPQAVFDTQLAYCLLARYGDDAPVPLEEIELRIERHLATLLALAGDEDTEGAPPPSLRVIQSPVFHGYSFSAWVEFESNPGVDTIEQSLANDLIEVRGPEFPPPNNVGQAGQPGIAVGAIQHDRNNGDACWFWLVADNVRLLAENALEVARQIL
jgi:aspartate-semialdehyde dehydrogenase